VGQRPQRGDRKSQEPSFRRGRGGLLVVTLVMKVESLEALTHLARPGDHRGGRSAAPSHQTPGQGSLWPPTAEQRTPPGRGTGPPPPPPPPSTRSDVLLSASSSHGLVSPPGLQLLSRHADPRPRGGGGRLPPGLRWRLPGVMGELPPRHAAGRFLWKAGRRGIPGGRSPSASRHRRVQAAGRPQGA